VNVLEKNIDYIKFKVWDFDKKEWVCDKETFAINGEDLYLIHPEGEWDLVDNHYKYKNIKICQYTEFKDCNGNPIFYGDILKAKTKDLYVVQKGRGDTLDGDSGFGYILKSIPPKNSFSENKILLHTCFANKNKKLQFYKKIGNKYENIELLEKE